MPQIQAGTLRALGVTATARLRVLPDIPPIGDVVPGFAVTGWLGIGVPKGTSAEIRAILTKDRICQPIRATERLWRRAKRNCARCYRPKRSMPPDEIRRLAAPAASPPCRSSSGNSLCGQNSAGFRESARPFKGIICDDISEFESYHPSHAVGLERPI